MEQGQGATISPTDDVTDVRGPSQREAPETWSRRVRTVTLPSYAPNPYEDSLCQETNSPSKRFFAFFSAFQGLAQAAVGRVF